MNIQVPRCLCENFNHYGEHENVDCPYNKTTPTTPSEWESNFYGFWTDNRITYSVMRDYIRSLLHHNTEDIIGAIEAESEKMKGSYYKMGLDRAIKRIRALKPTHKD